MAFFPKSEEEIISGVLNRLTDNTSITQLAPGGKARFFATALSKELSSQHDLFNNNLTQAYLNYANGRFLDFFGDMMNLPRLEARHAVADEDVNNVMFYVNSGTFGDINGGASFTIPSGTEISTASPLGGKIFTPGLEDNSSVTYRTISLATAISTSSFVFVPVRASIEGSGSNVPREVLISHQFSSYIQSTSSTLKITNTHAIDSGADREGDDSYRYRLANMFRANALGTHSAIRLAALTVPGVSNVVLIGQEQGPGTASVFVQTSTSTPSERVISEVSDAVGRVSSIGERIFVSAPSVLGLELVAHIVWAPKVKTEQIAEGYSIMRVRVEEYLNSQSMASSITVDDLIGIMLGAVPLARGIGLNKPNKFESTYINRAGPVDSSTVRSFFVGDTIQPMYNEKVILETSNKYRGIQFI